MREKVKHILSIFIVVLFIMNFSTVSFAADLAIDNDHVIYNNEEYKFSTILPVDSYIIFDESIYFDGEKQDVSGDDINDTFEMMKVSGALFYYLDHDFTYEISCSVMPLELDYDWDLICIKLENGEITAADLFYDGISDDIKAKYDDYIDDANASMLTDYYNNADISIENINGYYYMVTSFQRTDNNTYIMQYSTAVENEQYIFKFLQYSGTPNEDALVTFHQIINSSTLPPKSDKVSSTFGTDAKAFVNLIDNIFIRLASFLIVIAIIYGLIFLNNGRHKKEEPISWNPEIDYSEIPFSDSSNLREHILKSSHNISFLFRTTALSIAKSKKPYLSLVFLVMWAIAVILPIVEALFTRNWWILVFIPIGVLIPSYSRQIKSWMQIIPIAIGTIFSNPIIFCICINFVIVRAIYDLWYSSVLKTAGEVLCANDELFTQAWKDTALAVLVDGEPYFHSKLTQSDDNIIFPNNQASQNVQKNIDPKDATEHMTELEEADIKTTQAPTQENSADDITVASTDYKRTSVTINPPIIKFCNICGQKLETDYRFCFKCGNQIESNLSTGAKIQESPQEQQVSTTDKLNTNKSKYLSDEDIRQIKYWKQLLDDGIITEDEFKDKKKDILGG